MIEKAAYIFIDEFGTPDLEYSKIGNEQYFVYAAVVINEDNIQNARTILTDLYNKYFPARYIKSSRIPNDNNGYAKTICALTELKGLDHYVVALVIDKSKIKEGALSYKRSFIKFFQRFLSQRFFDLYSEVHICFDKTGDDSFKASLEEYMEKHFAFGPTLFTNNTFAVLDDNLEEPLIQLADLYAGTIGKYLCGRYDKNRAEILNNAILKSRLSIEWYPKEYIPLIAVSSSFDKTFDNDLFNISTKSATQYIENFSNDIVGREILLYLLQESVKNPLRHVSSKEIKANLCLRGIDIGDPIEKISQLRDFGVLVISPLGKKGYKFPTSEDEIADFYNRLSVNVIPQLKRGYLMNKLFQEKTFGRLNVMGKNEFETLYSLGEMAINKKH